MFISFGSYSLYRVGRDSSGASFNGWLYHNGSLTVGSNIQPQNYIQIYNKYGSSAYVQWTNHGTGYNSSSLGFKVGLGHVLTGVDAILNQQSNAGMYFYTQRKERAVIDSKGYVGIGLYSPAHTLHVHSRGINTHGGGNGLSSGNVMTTKGGTQDKLLPIGISPLGNTPYCAVQITNTATDTMSNDGLLVGVSGVNGFIRLQEQGEFSVNVNQHNAMRVYNSGKVSFNPVTTPEAQVNIFSTNSTNGLLVRNLNNPDGYGLKVFVNDASTNAVEVSGSSVKFVVNGSGKVGIGTVLPSSLLDVSGKITAKGLEVNTTGGPWNYLIHGNVTNDNTKSIVIDNNGITKFIVYGDGRVGIGTNDPQHELDVRGTGHFCKVIVKSDGWCDYVFDNDYTIMPLDSLELYIKTHRHLPGIPSQTEVIENGIDVGSINAKLLEKIEELTLYIIEQNKKIKELQRQIKELKN